MNHHMPFKRTKQYSNQYISDQCQSFQLQPKRPKASKPYSKNQTAIKYFNDNGQTNQKNSSNEIDDQNQLISQDSIKRDQIYQQEDDIVEISNINSDANLFERLSNFDSKTGSGQSSEKDVQIVRVVNKNRKIQSIRKTKKIEKINKEQLQLSNNFLLVKNVLQPIIEQYYQKLVSKINNIDNKIDFYWRNSTKFCEDATKDQKKLVKPEQCLNKKRKRSKLSEINRLFQCGFQLCNKKYGRATTCKTHMLLAHQIPKSRVVFHNYKAFIIQPQANKGLCQNNFLFE